MKTTIEITNYYNQMVNQLKNNEIKSIKRLVTYNKQRMFEIILKNNEGFVRYVKHNNSNDKIILNAFLSENEVINHLVKTLENRKNNINNQIIIS